MLGVGGWEGGLGGGKIVFIEFRLLRVSLFPMSQFLAQLLGLLYHWRARHARGHYGNPVYCGSYRTTASRSYGRMCFLLNGI